MPRSLRPLSLGSICVLLFFPLYLSAAEPPQTPAGQLPPKGEIKEMAIQRRLYGSPDAYFNTPQLKAFCQGAVFRNDKKSAIEQLKYEIETQKMCLFVPESYDGGSGWGLFVYTSPSPRGDIPGHFRNIMSKHKLIWAAPHEADNGKPEFLRIGLTLDAFATARSIYNVDPERVYVAGFSGGGTIATSAAVYYPSLFHGLVNFSSQYFLLKSPSAVEGYIYNWKWKTADTDELARHGHRFAFNTGNKDKNYREVKAAASAWKEIKLDAELFDQEGMGHSLPNAEYLDKMLTWMQEPQDVAAEKSLKAALAKKDYSAASQMLESFRGMPDWKPQAKLLDAALAEIDTAASAEADKILAASTPNLAAAREFARKWWLCPASKRVVDLCETQGAKLADDLLAQPNCTPASMRKFLTEWEGFACCEKIAAAYNKAGEALWTELQTHRAPSYKRMEFIAQFKGFPCAEPAVKELTPAGDEAWAKLAARPQLSPVELRSFIKKWSGVEAAEKAQAALNQLAEELYSKIGPGNQRRSQLQQFSSYFADTPAGQRAKKELGQ